MIAALETVMLIVITDESGPLPRVWVPALSQFLECPMGWQVWNGSAWVRVR